MNEFQQGWRVLLGSFLGMCIGVSSLYFYSIGIFLKPLAQEFGWGRGVASAASMVGTVVAALVALPIGRLVDRLGAVRVAVWSLALLAASFTALGSLTTGLASFLVLVAVLSLLSTGSSAIPFGRLLIAAFEKHRGLALGAALSGPGVGAMLMPPLLVPLIAAQGWRQGYFVLAVVIVIVLPLVWWLLRGSRVAGSAPAVAPERVKLLAHPAFVRLALVFFVASMGIFATIVHFVPLLTDAGLSPARAGALAGLIGITAIGGRVLAGFLLDRFNASQVTATLFAVSAVGTVALAVGGVSFAIPGALVAGFAIGAENDLLAYQAARYFPRPVYGQAFGALYGAFLIGGAVGPALSGVLFDATGTYTVSLLTSAGLLLVAAAGTRSFRGLQPVGPKDALREKDPRISDR